MDKNSSVAEELEKPKTWKLTEVNEPSLLRSIRLPDALNLVNFGPIFLHLYPCKFYLGCNTYKSSLYMKWVDKFLS